ncbi:MAG: hypothetical protein GY733_07645 [bacterium]|nr:hypothetical protein [bacterium]
MHARLVVARTLLLLAPVLLFIAPGAQPAYAGSDTELVCEPRNGCVKSCRAEAKRVKVACLEEGGSQKRCKRRAKAHKTACVADRCMPNRTCEQRCRTRGAALLRRCIVAGKPLDECRREAAAAAEACIDNCPQLCACPKIYAPVCGVDGNSYGNACEARCAEVEIEHEGPCEPECEPVLCELYCEHGFATGPDGCEICECNPDPCVCPDVWAPVCGVDGETYGNGCEARCAGVEIAHEGECRSECDGNEDCPKDLICYPPTDQCQPECQIQCFRYDPVCGEDGVTYGCGAADAHCHGVEVAHEGECRVECRDNRDCSKGEVCDPTSHVCRPACEIQCFRYDPVCGEDGVTYACGVQDAHCKGIPVAHEGECGVCYGDQDCGRGTHCNAADVCLPPPGCDRSGAACPAVCTGHCVAGSSPLEAAELTSQ